MIFLTNEVVERYQNLNKTVKEQGIIFTGSSLMEQFPVEEFLTGNIYNRGVSGFTTPEYLQVLDTLIFDLKPNWIFINIGTNDLNNPDYQLDELLANYQIILQQIKEKLPSTRVTFFEFYPVNPDKMAKIGENTPWLKEVIPFRTNQKLTEANQKIRTLMTEYDYESYSVNHVLVDKGGNLQGELSTDGIHLNQKAYRLIANELSKLIEQEK